MHNLFKFFNSFFESEYFVNTLLFKSHHDIADRNDKGAHERLVKATEDAVIDGATQSRAIKFFLWEGHVEAHQSVQRGVWAGSLWFGLDVLQVGAESGWDHTLEVEGNKRFLNWEETW